MSPEETSPAAAPETREPPTGALVVSPATITPEPVLPIPGVSRKWYQRWFLDPVRKQLKQGVTPDKIALTVAMGTVLGLFPLLGVTTAMCTLAAALMQLNLPIIQATNWVLYPVHILAIIGLLKLGAWTFHDPPMRVKHLKEEFEKSPWHFMQTFANSIWHATICWLVLAPIFAVLIYYTLRPVLRMYLKRPE